MTDADFKKIKDCKTDLKGSFKGVVIKASDLKSGTKNEKDWTKKTFTIQDDSDTADLVAWGDEIATFKIGYTYEIVNPWWKTYDGKVTVQVGNYGTAKVIGSNTTGDPDQNTIPDTPNPPKEQSTLTEPAKPSEAKTDAKIEKLNEDELVTVQQATRKLLAISLAVGTEVGKVTEGPSELFVMEASKLIYQNYFVSNFKKASDIK